MSKIFKNLKLSFFFKNPIYNFFLEKKAKSKILFNPEDFWGGSSDLGQNLINGYINFYGESSDFKNNIWEKNEASEFWNNQLHSFEWIRDVKAVGTNKARIFLRNNLLEWLKKNKNWDSFSWKIPVLSKRITNLLSNLSFYFTTADEDFQKKVSCSINKQSIHLHNCSQKEYFNNEQIFVVKALILSSLAFQNLRGKLDLTLQKLNQLMDKDIHSDGMHYLKSPSEHFIFLRSLLDIKNYLGTFKIKIPTTLNEKISLMTSILKFFRIGSGQLSIFNNYEYIENFSIDQAIKRANSKIKIPNYLEQSGFHRIAENRLVLIMDCGSPTREKTHAGSLSFELSHGNEKIVVNSGSPYIYNKKFSEAMRSTAAHSTASIENMPKNLKVNEGH